MMTGIGTKWMSQADSGKEG